MILVSFRTMGKYYSNLENVSISAFAAGDKTAYDQVYDHYYKFVHNWAYSIVQSTEDADDIAGDIFLKLWRYRDRFAGFDKMGKWLKVCTRHAALDFNSQKKRCRIVRSAEELAKAADDEYDFEYFRSEEKILLFIRMEIAKLPERSQQILDLASRGHKNEEIATILSMSEKTVRNLKSKAIITLRNTIALHYPRSIDFFYIIILQATLHSLPNSPVLIN